MTTSHILNAVSPLIADLAQDLSERERLRRLLAALRNLLPADAVALLKLEGEWLRPMAIDGLMPDTLGRCFRLGEHPRFAQLLAAGQAMRFEPDSPLPDPYDGLVAHKGQAISELHVHDCMGCVLQLGGLPWGLLTLDALEPGRFADPAALAMLQAFSNLAAATVATAERVHQLSQLARGATGSARAAAPQERGLQGASPVMRQLQKDIALVAASDLCVLVTGETGTGKELVAQAVHAQSGRADKPMISINCAALPDNLVESELFGHVRGAFTGALSERSGKFEQAHQGTLFLDEVGELSLPVQAKLLRVLQSGEVERLGGHRSTQVDVRVIAATNVDLEKAVEQGRFRRDLLYRLNVYPIRIPALRERVDDIELLAMHLLQKYSALHGKPAPGFSDRALTALRGHSWPGNVRELENLVERGLILTPTGEPIDVACLFPQWSDNGQSTIDDQGHLAQACGTDGDLHTASVYDSMQHQGLSLDALEDGLLQEAVRRASGNLAAAARALGMTRPQLSYRLSRIRERTTGTEE